MSKSTKIWLTSAAFLVIIGLIMFAVVLAVNNWDFTVLSTVKYETNTYRQNYEFNNISIETQTADIVFALSDDSNCKVVCYEAENAYHSVSVKDGTLTIGLIYAKKWYENIGIEIGSPKITVYLPKTEYGTLFIKESTGDIDIPKDLSFEKIDIWASTGDINNRANALKSIKIATNTGNITIENVTATAVDLSVSTGKISAKSMQCTGDIKINVTTGDTELTDIKCKSLISNGSTGDIFLNNVIAKQRFSIERSTGDVKFNSCDAEEIFITSDTGYVKGNLLSDKVFIAQSDTGNINVPKTVTGGKCEITTDTGDIKITVE